MQRRAILVASSLLASLLLAGCDNVVRAFNPGGGTGGGGTATNLAQVRTGGDVVDARPQVKAVFPDGAGWPASVPVVVVFTESMSEDSVAPASGQQTMPGLLIRDTASGNTVPASYDFLLGDQVVVIRPTTGLPSSGALTGGATLSYEVVATSTLRDIDGLALTTTEKVLATITPDEDTSIHDGRIVATLPLDGSTTAPRETPIYTIFDRPVDPTSLTTGNFVVRVKGGLAVPGQLSYPITTASVPDPRIVRFDPGVPATQTTAFMPVPLAASTTYEIVVDDTITFPMGGKLDFGNMTPFATFTTLAFSAAQDVTVAGAAPGFADKVNRNNLSTLMLDVALDDTARAGDSVLARIYGSAHATSATGDVDYAERSVKVPVDGTQTVTLDFSGTLGKVSKPLFDDGDLAFAAQTRRGTRHAGFIVDTGSGGPVQDLVQPDLVSVAPANGSGSFDVLTDQAKLALYGTASEKLGAASITLGSGATGALYASDSSGHFLLTPVGLGMATGALSYTLTITDAAGNMAAGTFPGNIVPHGVVSGSVSGGMLSVEAYDEATLQPLPGATVVIEPGMPTKPATGQQTAVTDAAGRVTFTGLAASSYTITVVASGHHLRTLLDTTAAAVSMPLEPIANATASLTGVAAFAPLAGWRALVGSNLLPDPTQLGVLTSTAAPITIPPTPVRPNRLQAISVFAGPIEPASVPAFAVYACQLCGANAMTPTPPSKPTAPGQTTTVALATTTVVSVATPTQTPTTKELAAPFTVDFSTATGLDTSALIGAPKVRVPGTLEGFAGDMLFGLGVASGSGSSYSVNATYSTSAASLLTPFSRVLFVSTQAEDTAGNVSRQRRLLDPTMQTTIATVAPLGIPTVSVPATSTGSPLVTYQDRLDPSAIAGGLGYVQIVATDPAGRRWDVLRQDADGAVGAVNVQLPDLSGSGVTGLATGAWTVRADARLVLSVTDAVDRFLFENVRRYEVAFARAAAATVTVN